MFEPLTKSALAHSDAIWRAGGDPNAALALSQLCAALTGASISRAAKRIETACAEVEGDAMILSPQSQTGDAGASVTRTSDRSACVTDVEIAARQLLKVVSAIGARAGAIEALRAIVGALENAEPAPAAAIIDRLKTAAPSGAEAKTRAGRAAVADARVREFVDAFRQTEPTRQALNEILERMRGSAPPLAAGEWTAVASEIVGRRATSRAKAIAAIEDWIQFNAGWEHAADSVKHAHSSGY